MSNILEVKDVTKYYGSGSIVTKALDGVSLEVENGGFTAIMGASGSGKTTLLNTISTIDRVSSGDIVIDDFNISNMNEKELASFRRNKLGFIFQDYNLLDTLTVGENILLPLQLNKVNPAKAKEKLVDIANKLGVYDQIDKFPRQLSGGQKQRVACARALINNPAIILADEPTGALDSASSKNLMKTFSLMNEQLNSTILMVTHDAVVGSYATRILFLKDGKIWNEINRGSRNRQAMYDEILNVMSVLGGEGDVR